MLITAGTPEDFSTMTASWVGLGSWRVPVADILVSPARYTFQFLEREEIFTHQSFATDTDPEGKSHRLFFGEILSVWVRK
jgi:flavin reductase (DIM6/NTAB) family NADH-FMN oxidoreductase RutF